MRRNFKLSDEELSLMFEEDLQISDPEAFKVFLNSRQVIGVTSKTMRNYHNVRKALLVTLQELDIEREMVTLTVDDVEAVIIEWQEQGYAVPTINSRLRVMRAYYRFLTKRNHIKVNPMEEISQVREPVIIKDTFSKEEIKLLANYWKVQRSFRGFRNLTIFQLLLDTGVRIKECIHIKIADIQGETIVIRDPKGLQQRFAYLSEGMQGTLAIYMKIRGINHSEYLFVNINGGAYNYESFRKEMVAAVKELGINKTLTPHSCRRTFCKFCILNKMDIITLAKLLGHSSVQMVEKYYHLYSPEFKEHAQLKEDFSKLF